MVQEARKQLPQIEHVILIDPPAEGAPEGTTALADVEGSNPGFDAAAATEALQTDDVLTLIYTSGTTGPPKGVELEHGNLLTAVVGIEEVVQFPTGSRVVSWLPAAHIAERAAHHYLPIVFGLEVTTVDNPREVVAVLPEVRPQWFFAVPRIWEKLKAGLETMVHAQPEEQRAPLEAALGDAVVKVRLEQAGEPVPADLAERVAAADVTYFASWRAMLGLDEVDRDQRGRRADAGRGARVLPRDRAAAQRAVGNVGDLRRRHREPPGRHPHRHRRPARPERRDQPRRRR